MSKKKVKKKICKTCAVDIIENEDRDQLRYTDTYHQLNTKEYCDGHEAFHSEHKCKPHWCGDCEFLIKYIVKIDHSKWDK